MTTTKLIEMLIQALPEEARLLVEDARAAGRAEGAAAANRWRHPVTEPPMMNTIVVVRCGEQRTLAKLTEYTSGGRTGWRRYSDHRIADDEPIVQPDGWHPVGPAEPPDPRARDKRDDETNPEYCRRLATLIPTEELVRAMVRSLLADEERGGKPAWSALGRLCGHGSGVSSAIVERYSEQNSGR